MMTAQAPQQHSLTPQQAVALAAELTEKGRLAEAEALCRKLAAAAPGFHPALFQLALIALQVQKPPVAAELLTQCIRLAPAHAPYYTALCEVARRMNKMDLSLTAGQKAVELAPDDAGAYYNFGVALAQSGRTDAALSAYRRALMLNPAHGLAANNLGTLQERAGDVEGAQKSYALAAQINPRHFEAQNNLGAILCAKGELEGAIAAFEQAIEANPAFVHAHYNLSSLKKYTKDDAHLKALETVLRQSEKLSAEERMRFSFALGKALEDTGRYDEAFKAYETGNRIKRQSLTYNEGGLLRNTEKIIKGYDKKTAKSHARAGCMDPTPIFILGMPRSGTTLTEQILSSHSAVTGAGEVSDFSDALQEISGHSAETDYMPWLATADDETLTRLGENYIARLRARAPGARHITDKMPGNYYYIGLIRKVLPQAKIIHTVRDAMDTCLSNYARLFNETMPFAYDLAELGRYHQNYSRLMAHWRKVLPKNAILDVAYEDMIADQEGQTRRLLKHCGLGWEESCLAFHKNDRLVKTASIAQVRRPIYTSSVARWQKFGDNLAPLRKALDDKLPQPKEDAA
jgi:tetratricopeptide (TPR) repeat protein